MMQEHPSRQASQRESIGRLDKPTQILENTLEVVAQS
jgi:hypothetical protein